MKGRTERNHAVLRLLQEGRALRKGWEKSLSSPCAGVHCRSISHPRPSTVVQSIISVQVGRLRKPRHEVKSIDSEVQTVPRPPRQRPKETAPCVIDPPQVRFPELWAQSNFRVSIVHIEDRFSGKTARQSAGLSASLNATVHLPLRL